MYYDNKDINTFVQGKIVDTEVLRSNHLITGILMLRFVICSSICRLVYNYIIINI